MTFDQRFKDLIVDKAVYVPSRSDPEQIELYGRLIDGTTAWLLVHVAADCEHASRGFERDEQRKPHVVVDQPVYLAVLQEVGGSAVLADIAGYLDVAEATARRKLDGLVAQELARVRPGTRGLAGRSRVYSLNDNGGWHNKHDDDCPVTRNRYQLFTDLAIGFRRPTPSDRSVVLLGAVPEYDCGGDQEVELCTCEEKPYLLAERDTIERQDAIDQEHERHA